MPAPPVASEQFGGSRGAGGTGGVVGEVLWLLGLPSFDNRFDDLPCRFHFIRPRKKGRVAAYTVENEMFICRWRFRCAWFIANAVVEIDRLQAHPLSTLLRFNTHQDAFFGRNGDDEQVGPV